MQQKSLITNLTWKKSCLLFRQAQSLIEEKTELKNQFFPTLSLDDDMSLGSWRPVVDIPPLKQGVVPSEPPFFYYFP
jgi:hypothetical protein